MESHLGSDGPGPLQIALVLDSLAVPAWIARIVSGIVSDPTVAPVVVLLSSLHPVQEPYLFRRYLAWDKVRANKDSDPLARVDLEEALRFLPSATLQSIGSKLDIVLWLSGSEPDLRSIVSRFGTWYFSHGLAGAAPDCGAYFPELVAQAPVSSTYLLAQTEPSGRPLQIAEAHTSSEIGWSLARQQSAPFWKAAMLPHSALKNLRAGNESVMHLQENPKPVTNGSVLQFAVRNTMRTLNRRFWYADKESHWFVAYRLDQSNFVATKGRFSAEGFQTLDAPPGHFYADPFVLTWKDRTFLFVEDYLYPESRGVLSVLELQGDGTFSPAQTILNRPYHLSYPFVFEQGGEVFMIPESKDSGRIELYRAVEMPYRWELVKFLREDVGAVDTTLWVADGVFYFFTNIQHAGVTANDVLSLFTADSLTGDWTPHPANPLSLDVRAARGAGKLFRMGDKLVRPAQDCSVRYGYATQLNEVVALTRDEFRERPLFRIEPDWAPNLIGTHTINSNDRIEVIDGQVYRPKYRRKSEES